MAEALDAHYRAVVREMLEGQVVPLLGAGVNLIGRSKQAVWERNQTRYLPSGTELASFLANYFEYPQDDIQDLLRISQYAYVDRGLGPLYRELHQLFDANYPPTRLHEFFAELPAILRERGTGVYQLIVTTNYDDALERAFDKAGEPFDLVSYVADQPLEYRGKFLHWRPGVDEPEPIEKPNEYTGLSLEERTIILKIHGAVARKNPHWDSYVITEDHYIEYLTRTDLSSLVPALLAAKLKTSSFLFLGYSLRDWNLRVILHRIWGEQALTYNSWAIQRRPTEVEKKAWNKRGVEILDVDLGAYVRNLGKYARELTGAGIGR
jgi:FAD/FMN-containing dehydrogenase